MRLFTLVILTCQCSLLFSQQKEVDSLKQAIQSQTGIEKVQSLNELSWHYKNFNIDSAAHFANEAFVISKNLKSDKGLAASLNSLANALEAKGNLDSALVLHNMSYKLKNQLNDSIGMANSLNNIGIAYDQLGKYDQSLESYFKALRLYESYDDQQFNVAMVLGNIGIVYKKQKEYEKVLDYYRRALDIYVEVNSTFGITVTKGNIGGVLLLTGDYHNAIKYSEEALRGYQEVGYSRYVPYMGSNIGIAYDSLGMSAKARSYYETAIDQHRENDNDFELSNTLTLLAANYTKTREYKKAIVAATEGYEIAEKINALEFKSRALVEWSKALAGIGNFTEAYSKRVLYSSLKDSLYEERKTKQIFELQTQYETEKKEQQIALQNAEIDEQKAVIQRNQILLIASVIAIILIISVALLQRSRLRKKQLLKLQEAQIKTKEAEINATISSQEKERSRYARDLHDGFGQMISILNMNLKNLKDGAKPNERQKVFDESSRVIDEMYGELKNICFDLMPQTLIKNGLESALQEFVSRINQTGKIFVELNVFGFDKRLSEIQEISLYRISQEWINNILKYSNAQKVTLQITKDDEEITLLIEDDGEGFDKNLLTSGQGNGWKNLNTRTNLIKGELELETHPGIKGNTLIINAPTQPALSDPREVEQNTVEAV